VLAAFFHCLPPVFQHTAILMDLIESEFSENSAVLPRTWGPKMPLFSKHFCDNWQIPAS
jgi:hypothetical protein